MTGMESIYKDEWKHEIRGRRIRPIPSTNLEEPGFGVVIDPNNNDYIIKTTKHENQPEPKFDKDGKEIVQPVVISYSQEFVFTKLQIYSEDELDAIVAQIVKYKLAKFGN